MQAGRFEFPECEERRSWEELAEQYQDVQHMFITGSLGLRKTENFEEYACFISHPCLLKVTPFPASDAMCYKYHEKEQRWYALGLMSEMNICHP